MYTVQGMHAVSASGDNVVQDVLGAQALLCTVPRYVRLTELLGGCRCCSLLGRWRHLKAPRLWHPPVGAQSRLKKLPVTSFKPAEPQCRRSPVDPYQRSKAVRYLRSNTVSS